MTLSIVVDLARNVLTFAIGEQSESVSTKEFAATIDVGEEGRLVGVEIDLGGSNEAVSEWLEAIGRGDAFDPAESTLYLSLDDGERGLTRTASVVVTGNRDSLGKLFSFELPRKGDGYELSYPSGNRCWVSSRSAAIGDIWECRWQ